MKNLVYLSAICILTFSACDVETGGCTDHAAINYESFADYDDGSCFYQSDVVFYEDVAAAVYFDAQNVNFLDIYVEGDYVGTLQANLGFTYTPDCFPIDPDAVHFTLEWDNAPATSFTWTVRDGTGYMWYNGTETVVPNDCTPMQLSWKKIKEFNNLQ